MTTANYLASAVQLMDICESELLFDTLPIAKTQRQYIKRVWMKNSIVEERIDSKCNRIDYLVNGKRHRTNGKPAIVCTNGGKFWYINDKHHRVGGPAVIKGGHKAWYFNDKIHNAFGPAINVIGVYDKNEWFVNNKYHRVDGPAIIWHTDCIIESWYINDVLRFPFTPRCHDIKTN